MLAVVGVGDLQVSVLRVCMCGMWEGNRILTPRNKNPRFIQRTKPFPPLRLCPLQVTGEATYTDDTKHTADVLVAVLVTSTRPHARLVGVRAACQA